jgi:hypothetical protein
MFEVMRIEGWAHLAFLLASYPVEPALESALGKA